MAVDFTPLFCGRQPGSGWSFAELAASFSMWLGMILAMLAPIVLPWTIALARQGAARGGLGGPVRLALFLLGYLAVWSSSGVAATLLQGWLAASGALSTAQVLEHPRVAGTALVVVGLYQWTPLKRACLKHCQSPITFLLTHWRDGAWGAVWMGGSHGLHCIGCCWLLMALMLATGAMSLPWMAGVGGFVLMEMYVPRLRSLSRLAGAGLIGLGVLIPLLA